MLGDLSRLANESGIAVADGKVTPEALAELIALAEAKTINSKIAKDVLGAAVGERRLGQSDRRARRLGPGLRSERRRRLRRRGDRGQPGRRRIVQSSGKENALKFLVGQVMKASRGKANPTLVEQLLREKITAT